MECFVRFIDGEWVVSKSDDKFDFFSGCKCGGSGNVDFGDYYFCIYGLVFKYDEERGVLNVDE